MTIKRVIAASVIGAGLAGCVSAPAVREASQATPNRPSKSPIALQAYQRTAIENAVKGKLKDPYSAMFSSVIAFRQKDSRAVHVCGLVNAKNSFGGYTGGKSFYALARYETNRAFNTTDIFVTIDDMVTQMMVREHCL